VTELVVAEVVDVAVVDVDDGDDVVVVVDRAVVAAVGAGPPPPERRGGADVATSVVVGGTSVDPGAAVVDVAPTLGAAVVASEVDVVVCGRTTTRSWPRQPDAA
jgi:hypothetical protein